MKTRSTSTLKVQYKTAGVLMFILACFYGFDLQAQGDRRGGDNRFSQGQPGGGQNIRREPSIRQQSPGVNRFPSQGRPSNTGIGSDRVNSRITNTTLNRPATGDNRPRSTTGFNRQDYNNNNGRPGNTGNIGYNRPGNTRPGYDNDNRAGYNNRPGYGNNNRPDYGNDRPGYNNRPGYGNANRYGNNYNRYPGNRDNRYNSYNNYNNYRRPAYNAGNPNWRYAYAPRRNSVFSNLPSSYFSINFGGFGYRYYDGIFYRPYDNVFRVVAPPVGIFINVLPIGYSRIYVHDYPYYYYNGTYYDQQDDNYTVVSPPVGAVVESLPDGYETMTFNGETYYMVDGAEYKPVTQDNGEIGYEVVKAN